MASMSEKEYAELQATMAAQKMAKDPARSQDMQQSEVAAELLELIAITNRHVKQLSLRIERYGYVAYAAFILSVMALIALIIHG